MFLSRNAGAARPRYKSLRALTSAALLSSPAIVAIAAPTLSGTPATTVTAAHYYAFQPGVTGSVAGKLVFSIVNKPSWAQFDTGTGRLYGTPLPQSNVGTFSNISISASDSASHASLRPFSITVQPLPATPPVIGGTPAGTVVAGHAYSFQPSARDPNGLTLIFAISNKPAWATFNSTNGLLSGNPASASVGTYSNISITAYDGYAKAVLPAFAIVVQAAGGSPAPPPVSPPPVSSTGSATLSWTPPTETSVGTTLTNLAGYHIYYGTTPALGQSVTVANPGLTRYVLSGLSAATWYFQLKAYDTAGVESPPTATESLVLP
jgi:hypothetical protein